MVPGSLLLLQPGPAVGAEELCHFLGRLPYGTCPPTEPVPGALLPYRIRSFPARRPVLLALLVSGAVAACADPTRSTGPGDPGGPGDPPVVDSATTIQFANTALGLVDRTLHAVYGGQSFETPNVFILPSLGAAAVAPRSVASAACVPLTTGVDTAGAAIDSDGDGTPDDFTVDYGAGCTQDLGSVRFTFSGSYRLRDPDGGVASFEFTSAHLSAAERDSVTGNAFAQSVTGPETATFNAQHATHQMDMTYEVTSRTGGDSAASSLRTVESSSYDPDGGSTFQLHGSLPQGTLHFGAQLIFRDRLAGTDSMRFVLSAPTPIHTSFACVTGIDGGVLQGLLEGDSRVGFRYTWTGCAAPALELFGMTP